MSEIPFPVISAAAPDAEGVLATWFVADGEQVGEGDLIAEVAVDKIDMEVVAPCAGAIRLLAGEGDVLTPGTPIARIE